MFIIIMFIIIIIIIICYGGVARVLRAGLDWPMSRDVRHSVERDAVLVARPSVT